ncbi:unnamed protein product (mitochondrion) [Plasmodiophora brassicae]|uniref:Uncharacterized protein n=1 Tax=Plasmodiophora brassicae TaxID=37360 RepID=A0A3P3YKZ8_PLABS|nr:unnamed protein product [Plasmodiophora brassicae]
MLPLTSTRSRPIGTEAKSDWDKALVVTFICGIALRVALTPARIAVQPSPLYSKLMTMDEHTYTEHDLPYFDESVQGFRERVSSLIRDSRQRTVFVSLASFRDDLCPSTLADLFDKAQYPMNVYVGLVDQVKLSDDSDDVPCESMLDPKYHGQVRHVRVPASAGAGPTHARYIASKLYEGEEFYLQIDSHSHFAPNWDTSLMAQIDRLPDPHRGILSHYPPPDDTDMNNADSIDWICCVKQHADAPPGLFITLSDWCTGENRSPGIAQVPGQAPTTCVTPFIGGGMIVGRGQWVVDVPFDKYVPYLFHGEELLISARLWTSGWDIFTPTKNIVDHKYGGRAKNVYAESNSWAGTCELSQARARYLLGTTLPSDAALAVDLSEIDDLGMGSERSYEAYLEFAGINLAGGSTGRCGQRYDWQNKVWLGDIKPMGT